MPQPAIAERLAQELSLDKRSVVAVIALLDDGATVPFIARYRKERTGNLDEVQIRSIEEWRGRLATLEQRRGAILAAIEKQGKLTPALREAIAQASSRAALEDLYLPYKSKRRTRAGVARDRGLLPLAQRILLQPERGDPRQEAVAFVNPGKEVANVEAALAGARDIVAEVIAENVSARRTTREAFMWHGRFVSKAARGKAKERSKFEQYYDFAEPVTRIPSHRVLAVVRGESEGFLKGRIEVDRDRLLVRIEDIVGLRRRSPFAAQLKEAAADSLSRLLGPSVENDVRSELQVRAHRDAVDVFATNLQSLLLAAPLGEQAVIGIDPGLRTGCKCAAVDATGRFVENLTLFLERKNAPDMLLALVKRHRPRAIAVGNGTAGRETFAFARTVLKDAQVKDVLVVSVNESGASVYSASDVAREEHPDLDLTVRGAISIARRLQDPLSELVKIDPKAIGVGQYQHDVDQKLLSKKLATVTESCVNRVGVELNTASASLLTHVAGVGPALAKRIATHRKTHGRFASRAGLLKIKGLGPKVYEQCAGFVRVRNGAHPLDDSAVHPERYPLEERIAADLGVSLTSLASDNGVASRIDVERYADATVGAVTLQDIVRELEKPGRDPRETFEAPQFRDDVHMMADLRDGMVLQGVVTNVTHFGAFVDVGVHQDGLVHISEIADHYVADPRDVVKTGDRITVRVVDIDHTRKRIGLSARRE